MSELIGTIVITGFIFMWGCIFSNMPESKPVMTRQQTIAAIKECRDAGLHPVVLSNDLTGDIKAVNCVP